MRYAFIAEHSNEFPVTRMCEMLEVPPSGYYAWRKRPPSRREQANRALLEEIRKEHQASRETYGGPRIHAALKRRGVVCSRNRVARLMRLHGILGRVLRRHRPVTTQREPGALAAPNLLNQDFTTLAPNQKWVADITYVDTVEGWLYLALVLDLFSRGIVGWAMAAHMEAVLVEDALQMAIARRLPAPGLLHHSDQGTQYTSSTVQTLLAAHQAQVSMSGVGNCYDNAPMESFVATLKTECVTRQFETRALARVTIFEYIEVWYNRQRLHSSLGYLSPEEFERQHFPDTKSVH